MATKKTKEAMKAVPKTKLEVETNGHDVGFDAQGRMGKKSWSGTLMIGAISIPVALYAAAREERIPFNMLHSLCHGRVRQAGYYCPCCIEVEVVKAFTHRPEDGEPVQLAVGQRIVMHADDVAKYTETSHVRVTDNAAMLEKDDIVKGFEVSKDNYTVITKEEIDSQKPESSSYISIEYFWPVAQVNPVYFQSSYYLPADNPAVKNKSYSVLRAGLVERKVAAVGKICMRQKEDVVFIFPHPDGGMIAYTAYLADEIRQVAFQPLAEVSVAELNAVCKFIDAMTEPAKMTEFRDVYRENMMKLIEAKQEGREAPKVVLKPKPVQSDNLLEMLQASAAIAQQRKNKKTA